MLENYRDERGRPLRWDDCSVSITMTNRDWIIVREALLASEERSKSLAKRSKGGRHLRHEQTARSCLRVAAIISTARKEAVATFRRKVAGDLDLRLQP